VAINGTSYGGYASLMAILRHPDVFYAASCSSSVTDWRHYDTIYTERYMGLPWDTENKKGYDEGSAMNYIKNLKGKLMLYYGTADNNVHPANTLQLVKALEAAGKRYDMQVGPDRGHTGINSTRMWEYFVTHLILNAPKDALATIWKPRAANRAVKL
jgi:dipeptidyl-peptidase 4